jgi:hypothetical protein
MREYPSDIPPRHRQVSSRVMVPLPGVVNKRFGSDSHVTLLTSLRMYLYCIYVFAGRVTLTVYSDQVNKGEYERVICNTYGSKSDNSLDLGVAHCPLTNIRGRQRIQRGRCSLGTSLELDIQLACQSMHIPPNTVVAFTLKVAVITGPGFATHLEGTIRPSAPQLAGFTPAREAAAVRTDA